MDLHRTVIDESLSNKLRCGIVPFTADGRALFAVSSDAAYGGSDPAIAKGRADAGEESRVAAIREGEEELGLRQRNMEGQPFLGWSGEIKGLEQSYQFEVWAVLVKDEKDFGPHDHETAYTVWMTPAEFSVKGRKSHRMIMDKIYDKIEAHTRK